MESQFNELIDTVLEYDGFSEDLKKQAEWVIGDTVISALYGLKAEEEISRYLNNASNHAFGKNHCFPVLGTNMLTNRKDSLIIHGTAIVSNELDEGNTFAKGHPSAHILPSLLVSAYENDATTDQVIDAYIRAYEISSRLAYAIRMRDDMHPHGTWGNVGGAVVRALLEGRDKEAIKEIVLIALSLPLSTSWLAAERGQSVRNLYTGIGSFLAYESASFQQYGFGSNMGVVGNLWSNIMGEGIDADRLTESLMDPPLITKNYFKVHPACRFTHAAIDATLELMEGNKIEHEEIDKVEIGTYNLAARCDTRRPETRLQSKFSIPYAVACTLMDVNMFRNYEENFPQVKQLADRVYVSESPELTNLLPDSRAANVAVTLKDGTLFEHMVYTAQGEYDHPFSEEALWDKYRNMLTGHYSDNFLDVLKKNLLSLRRYPTFKEWLQVNQLTEGSTCKR